MPNPYRAFVASFSRFRRVHTRRIRRRSPRPGAGACERLEDRTLLVASLGVTIDQTYVYENWGATAARGTVTRVSDDYSQPLTVSLSSSDPSEVTVPATVTIPAGYSSAGFAVSAVDDNLLDGTQHATITATAQITSAASPGAFDMAFGVGENVAAVVPLGDGRFYTVGFLLVDGVNVSTGNLYDIVVRRFNANGTADNTFGINGRVQLDLTGRKEMPEAAVLQPDGKLLIAGSAGNGPYTDYMLVRLNADGSLDRTFGQPDPAAFGQRTGFVIRDIDPQSGGHYDVALLADGKILVTGGTSGYFALTRYNADGSLDTTFGTGGTSEAVTAIYGGATRLAVQPDGRIVVIGTDWAGNNYSKVGLARFNANGAIDSTFGSNGSVLIDLPGRYDTAADVALQADGKIVIAASTSEGIEFPPIEDFIVTRYNANGTLDTTFGTNGLTRTDLGGQDMPEEVKIAADGSIVVVGRYRPKTTGDAYSDESEFAIYSASGGLIRSLHSPNYGRGFRDVVVLADGRMLLGGDGLNTFTGYLARYQPPGPATTATYTATAPLDVLDSEVLSLLVTSAQPITFGQTATVRVTRSNSDNSQPLTVRIVSDDPSELVVPATVVIPAGDYYGYFQVQMVDNGRPDGNRKIGLHAEATGYSWAPASVSVVEPGTTSLNAWADGTVIDSGRNGTWDSAQTAGDRVTTWLLQGYTTAPEEERGVYEFDVSPIAATDRVTAASLTVRSNIATFSSGSVLRLQVYAYRGDGRITPSDGAQTGLKVGELVIDTSVGSPIDILRRWTIQLDAAAMQSLVGSGGVVGLVTALAAPDGSMLGVYSSEATYADPADRPRLNFTLTPNRPPVFGAASYSFAVTENSANGTAVGQVSATDSDGDTVLYSIAAGNDPGAFAIDAKTGAITVADASKLDYEATTRFTLTVRAFDLGPGRPSSDVTVSIDLTNVIENTAPAIAPQSFSYWLGSSSPSIGTVAASDSNGDALTFSIDAGNESHYFVLDPVTGALSLASGFQLPPGEYTLTVRATDDGEANLWKTTAITVTAFDNTPAAADDAYATDEDTPLSVAGPGVLANDTDADTALGEVLSALLVDGPAHGMLALSASGDFLYTPAANYNGTDRFTYRARDKAGFDSGVAAVTITVRSVNDVPAAAADSYRLNEDTTLTVPAAGVLANDTDADGDPLTVTSVAGPSHGTLLVNADGSFTYTPAANYNGTDSFSYNVGDGNGGTATATVALTIDPVNDPPTASGVTVSTEGKPSVTVTIVASDVEGDALTYARGAGPAHGTVTQSATDPRRFTYTPTAGYFGPDSFAVTVSDGKGGTATATVSVTVNRLRVAVNVDPSDGTNTINIARDSTVSVAVLGSATFDVRTVNVASLTFGKQGNELSLTRDRRGRTSYNYTDVNGDGVLDLVVSFDVADLGLTTADVGKSVPLTLRGSLSDGTLFEGSESVNVVSTKKNGR